MVGGGGGWAVLTPANCHCSSKAWSPPESQGASFRLSHLKEALGWEAGSQSYSLETGRTLGAWEVVWNQHTEGPGSHRRCVPLSGPAPRGEGHLQGMLWAQVAAPHSLHSAPSRPLRSRGGLRTGLPGGQCVWDRQGRRQSGRGGPDGGGRASVVLKERQEVIITIARQVRGVQVREELVRICEFWKEIQRRLRHVRCSLCSGLTL